MNFLVVWRSVVFFTAILGHACTAQQLLPQWASTDVGTPMKTGAAEITASRIVITGTGRDIWGTDLDQFHFVYQQREGNCELSASVEQVSSDQEWAKSGLMIRKDKTPQSPHVFLFIRPDGRVASAYRDAAAAETKIYGPMVYCPAARLKLLHEDDYFISYYSCDGRSWMYHSSVKIPSEGEWLSGLAVTSHDESRALTVAFSDVVIDSVAQGPRLPDPPEAVFAHGIWDDETLLTWRAVVKESVVGYNIYSGKKKLNLYLVKSNHFRLSSRTGDLDSVGVTAVDVMDNESVPSVLRRERITVATPAAATGSVVIKNPYSSRKKGPRHWSDALPWGVGIDVSKIKGLVGETQVVDQVKLRWTMDSLGAQGGGVIYFPPGKYFFHDDVMIPSRVILAGAPPVHCGESTFYLPTVFEFARYHATTSGAGTNNESAFKKIRAASPSVHHVGLLYIDINRAAIEFLPDYRFENKGRTPNLRAVPNGLHSNIFIWGIRQNNVASLAAIPTKTMEDEGHGWQRWPYEFGTNINIFVSKNCLIAHSLINDQPTDDFEQPRYLTNGFNYLSATEARFRYLNREIIAVNSNFHKIGYKDRQIFRFDPVEVWEDNKPYLPADSIEISNNIISHLHGEYVQPLRSSGDLSANTIYTHFIRESISADGREALKNTWSAVASADTLFSWRKHVTTGGNVLPYRLMAPRYAEKGRSFPLIVFLHGVGEAGTDNMAQLKYTPPLFATEAIRANYPCYMVCPQHPPGQDFTGNSGVMSWSLESTIAIADSLVKSGSVDHKRIYLIGISAGGKGALDAIINRPGRFSAAVLLGTLCPDYEAPQLKKMRKTSLWFFNGGHDNHLPVPYVKKAFAKLEQHKLDATLTIYPETGHGVFVEFFDEPGFLDWLFSKRH